MALIFADSFDHYSDAQALRKWDSRSGSPVVTAAIGRNSTAGLRGTTTSGQYYERKSLAAAATYIVGHSIYSAASPSDTRALCGFYEGATLQVSIVVLGDGRIQAKRGSSTVLGTSTLTLTAPQNNYIEYKITASDAAGVVVVKVNGITFLNLSSQDTNNGGSSTISNFYAVGDGNAASFAWDIDDLYICDTTGSAPQNDFLGDVRVQAILPTGAGNYTQWTPSAGSNYQNVDENPTTDDTDYNSSSTANQKDTFVFGDVTPTAGTVYGVAVNMMMRKDDGGVRTLQALARLSSTDANGATLTVGSSYANYQTIFETKPGGGAFSITDVNNSEFGYELIS